MKNLLTTVFLSMCLIGSSLAFAEDVYATKNGKKYHKADCLLIKNKGAKPVSMEEAQKKGLKPCHKCFGKDAGATEAAATPTDPTTQVAAK